MKIRRRLSVLIPAVFILFWANYVSAEPFTLQSVQNKIEKRYPTVTHITTHDLAEKLGSNERVLLFDVREKEEYAVSRIPGARRVDPSSWSWSFIRNYAKEVQGKIVVFYCSVGVRSSRLAESVQNELKKNGAKAVFNLEGGIFAWHNESRSLANTRGPTRMVHPYDDEWGNLLIYQKLKSTR